MLATRQPQKRLPHPIKKPGPEGTGQTYTRGGKGVLGDHRSNCNSFLSHLLSRCANKSPVNAIVELFAADFAAREFLDLRALFRSNRTFAG